MERQDESAAAAQARDRLGLRFQCALEFQVDNRTACGMGRGEHFQLRSQRTFELTAIGDTAAGTDGGDVLGGFKKAIDFGMRGPWLLDRDQTELVEAVLTSHGLGAAEHCVQYVRV